MPGREDLQEVSRLQGMMCKHGWDSNGQTGKDLLDVGPDKEGRALLGGTLDVGSWRGGTQG